MTLSKNRDEDTRVLLSRLEDLGLSNKEARVYAAMLPHQDLGSSKIILLTGLHGQFVYDALARLEELGLVQHVIINGRKKFTANSPDRLLALVENKRLSAESVARTLKTTFHGKREKDFEVYQGESAFISHELLTLQSVPEGSEILVISGEQGKYWSTLQSFGFAEEYEHIRKKRNIKVRCVAGKNTLQDFQRMNIERWGVVCKMLPGLSTGYVDTDIWHDQVHFNTFDDPIFSFALTGSHIASGYKQFFETLWKLAR